VNRNVYFGIFWSCTCSFRILCHDTCCCGMTRVQHQNITSSLNDVLTLWLCDTKLHQHRINTAARSGSLENNTVYHRISKSTDPSMTDAGKTCVMLRNAHWKVAEGFSKTEEGAKATKGLGLSTCLTHMWDHVSTRGGGVWYLWQSEHDEHVSRQLERKLGPLSPLRVSSWPADPSMHLGAVAKVQDVLDHVAMSRAGAGNTNTHLNA